MLATVVTGKRVVKMSEVSVKSLTKISEGHQIIIASLLATVVTHFWVVIFSSEIQ